MKCSDFEDLISAYANDELPRTQREFIEAHLSGCEKCRKLLAEYITVKQDVSRLRDLSPEFDSSKAIMLRISEQKTSSPPNNSGNKKGFTYRVFDKRSWVSVSLAFVLVLGLSLGWLFISDNAQKVQAKEVVLQNPEIQAILDGYDLDSINISVENAASGCKYVALRFDTDFLIVAEVDTKTYKVVELYVFELNEEFKRNIIEIVSSNEEVQGFLKQGAVFTGFKIYYWVYSLEYTDFNGGLQHSDELFFTVNIRMNLNTEQWWNIQLNLDTNEIRIMDNGVLPGYHGYKLFSAILAYIVMAAGVIGIIGAVKNRKPAIVFIKILPLAIFAWGIYVFYFNPVLMDAVVFAVVLILLIVGIISGIIGIKKSASRKGRILPVIGIVLCLIFTAMIITLFTQNTYYGFIPFQ